MVCYQQRSALACVTAHATITLHTVIVDQKLASSSPDLQKHLTCAVLLDVGNMVLAPRIIWAADSQ